MCVWCIPTSVLKKVTFGKTPFFCCLQIKKKKEEEGYGYYFGIATGISRVEERK